MPATPKTDKLLHYLVLDTQGENRVYVFMDRDPALNGGPAAEAVTLELLPGGRVFSNVVLGARPVLGQDPKLRTRFREFRNDAELEKAKYHLILHYRICDSWDDYQNPWFTPAPVGGSTGSKPGA